RLAVLHDAVVLRDDAENFHRVAADVRDVRGDLDAVLEEDLLREDRPLQTRGPHDVVLRGDVGKLLPETVPRSFASVCELVLAVCVREIVSHGYAASWV